MPSHDQTLIYPGDEVKALGGGKVAGYLVRFGGPDSADIQNDFFDAKCDFGLDVGHKLRVYFHHGIDPTYGKRHYGVGEVKTLPDGMWVDGRIDLSTDKGRSIYADAEAGKLGWSSGSADRFVERVEVKGKRAIVYWPLNDASLSPRPVDPRNRAYAIKALYPEASSSQTPADGAAPASLLETSERLVSEAQEIVALWDAAIKSRQTEGRSLSEAKQAALKSLADEFAELVRVARPGPTEADRLRVRAALVRSYHAHGRI